MLKQLLRVFLVSLASVQMALGTTALAYNEAIPIRVLDEVVDQMNEAIMRADIEGLLDEIHQHNRYSDRNLAIPRSDLTQMSNSLQGVRIHREAQAFVLTNGSQAINDNGFRPIPFRTYSG